MRFTHTVQAITHCRAITLTVSPVEHERRISRKVRYDLRMRGSAQHAMIEQNLTGERCEDPGIALSCCCWDSRLETQDAHTNSVQFVGILIFLIQLLAVSLTDVCPLTFEVIFHCNDPRNNGVGASGRCAKKSKCFQYMHARVIVAPVEHHDKTHHTLQDSIDLYIDQRQSRLLAGSHAHELLIRTFEYWM